MGPLLQVLCVCTEFEWRIPCPRCAAELLGHAWSQFYRSTSQPTRRATTKYCRAGKTCSVVVPPTMAVGAALGEDVGENGEHTACPSILTAASSDIASSLRDVINGSRGPANGDGWPGDAVGRDTRPSIRFDGCIRACHRTSPPMCCESSFTNPWIAEAARTGANGFSYHRGSW